jgi:hypothetical protein
MRSGIFFRGGRYAGDIKWPRQDCQIFQFENESLAFFRLVLVIVITIVLKSRMFDYEHDQEQEHE